MTWQERMKIELKQAVLNGDVKLARLLKRILDNDKMARSAGEQ